MMRPYSPAGEMLKKLLPQKEAGEEVEVIYPVPDQFEEEVLAHQLWIKREIYRCTFYPHLPPTPYPQPERPFPRPTTKTEGE